MDSSANSMDRIWASEFRGRSLVAQMGKNPPATQETWVWPLGWEDALEKGMATHSSLLAWKILWIEKPGQATQSMGSQRVRHDFHMRANRQV